MGSTYHRNHEKCRFGRGFVTGPLKELTALTHTPIAGENGRKGRKEKGELWGWKGERQERAWERNEPSLIGSSSQNARSATVHR